VLDVKEPNTLIYSWCLSAIPYHWHQSFWWNISWWWTFNLFLLMREKGWKSLPIFFTSHHTLWILKKIQDSQGKVESWSH